MDEIDVPQYFLCPISLQIMKDPVTTVTGITYDRESIQKWLSAADATAVMVCPVTKQPLAEESDLTPNHMLRRLIQAWCIANAKNGIDRIPTPKSPLSRSVVLKLIREVNRRSGNSSLLTLNALKKMEELAGEDEKNRQCMAEAGTAKSMVLFILRCFKEGKSLGLEESLRILHLTWRPTPENRQILEDNMDFVESILWVLNSEMENNVKTHALVVLKNASEVMSSSLIERLNLDFFKQMVQILQKNSISPQATKAVLNILIQICPFGRSKTKIVDSGAVFEVIEMELRSPEKKIMISELIFCLLAQLCSCADGRQEVLKHAGGIALAAKRLLRISPASDDRIMCIMESIARSSATREVVQEMLRVGAVSKLCMMLQADCADYLKKKAREILRLHSKDWSDSPCIQVYLFTRYTR